MSHGFKRYHFLRFRLAIVRPLPKDSNQVISTSLRCRQLIKKVKVNPFTQGIQYLPKIHTVSLRVLLIIREIRPGIYLSIFSEPPSQPGEPNIVDFDNKSVTLRWEKPRDDGGRPITHYVIQKKDKFGGWFDALVTDNTNCEAKIDELEARVPGLSEGKWYQFRVIAVNKAGESEPSPHTKPHLCRHKNCKQLHL